MLLDRTKSKGAAMLLHGSSFRIIVSLALVSPAFGAVACFAHGGGGHGGGGHGGHGGHVYISLVPGPAVERVVIVHLARCDALNVQVIVPSAAWTRDDPRAIGSHSNFLLTRKNPEMHISLAAERVGIEANATNRTLLAVSKDKMKALPDSMVLPGEWQVAGQNIQGLSYHASAEQDGKAAHYAIWVASRNGYNYKLAVYGEKKYAPAIDSAMQDFVHGMKQLDPKRIAHIEKKIDVAHRVNVRQIQFEEVTSGTETIEVQASNAINPACSK
jgi:hypothetical protein